jgi:hypothetical protein
MGDSRKGRYIQRVRVTRSLLERKQVVLGEWNVVVFPCGSAEVVRVFHHKATVVDKENTERAKLNDENEFG